MNPNTPVNDTSGWLAFNNSFSEALAWATEKLSQPFAAPNIPSAGVEDRNDAPAAASGDGANASADAGKTEKQRLAEQHEAEAYEILSSLIKTYFTDIPLNPFQTIAALHLYISKIHIFCIFYFSMVLKCFLFFFLNSGTSRYKSSQKRRWIHQHQTRTTPPHRSPRLEAKAEG